MFRLVQMKRTLTPDKAPPELAPGELAIAIANTPPRIWVGGPGGEIKEFGDMTRLEARIAELEERIAELESTLRLLARGTDTCDPNRITQHDR